MEGYHAKISKVFFVPCVVSDGAASGGTSAAGQVCVSFYR
jgi:hypothetical protein